MLSTALKRIFAVVFDLLMMAGPLATIYSLHDAHSWWERVARLVCVLIVGMMAKYTIRMWQTADGSRTAD